MYLSLSVQSWAVQREPSTSTTELQSGCTGEKTERTGNMVVKTKSSPVKVDGSSNGCNDGGMRCVRQKSYKFSAEGTDFPTEETLDECITCAPGYVSNFKTNFLCGKHRRWSAWLHLLM